MMFDDMDEMVAAEAAAQDEAAKLVQPWQREIAVGDKFVKVSRGFAIFGEVLDPSEVLRQIDADEDEIAFETELRAEPHMQNFRFCRLYSPIYPEGQMGDVHIATVSAIISEDIFETFRKRGWRVNQNDLVGVLKNDVK